MQLIESGKAEGLFPSDVIQRAKRYLAAMPGGTGAYSDSRGAMVLRKDIAKVQNPPLCMQMQLPSHRQAIFCLSILSTSIPWSLLEVQWLGIVLCKGAALPCCCLKCCGLGDRGLKRGMGTPATQTSCT